MDRQNIRQRTQQAVLIATFVPFCWLAMMIVHEMGHILAAAFTGGHITKVVLYPLDFSRTDVSPNQMPTWVVWSGPILGNLIPVSIWLGMRFGKIPGDYLARFFAGFCLIANGAYIGAGSFEKIGDAGDMIQLGSPTWTLWGFGLVSVTAGFAIWHQLGPNFGLGESRGKVDPMAAYVSAGLFTVTFLTMLLFSPRF